MLNAVPHHTFASVTDHSARPGSDRKGMEVWVPAVVSAE
jgi:hypothetical protein